MRGYLAGTVPSATLALWTSPSATPQIIRAIAGRLVAAFYYRERYSEDSLDDPQYAKIKYDEAMAFLMGILEGTIVIEEIDPLTTGERFDELNFFPNDSTPGPYFTMEMKL